MRPLFTDGAAGIFNTPHNANFLIVARIGTGEVLPTRPRHEPMSFLVARTKEVGHKPLYGIRVRMKK